MSDLIGPDRWREIDDLLLGELKIVAIKRIRELSGLDLQNAVALMFERYEKLKRERPEDFSGEPRTYTEER